MKRHTYTNSSKYSLFLDLNKTIFDLKFNLLFILCFLSTFGMSQLTDEQIQKIDSLKTVIAKCSNDTALVKSLIELDNIIYFADPKLDFKLSIQIDSICSNNLKKYATSPYKSCKKSTAIYKDGKNYSLSSLGTIYMNQGDFHKAEETFKNCLELGIKEGNIENQAMSLNNLGVAYSELSQYHKAKASYQKGLKICKAMEDKVGECSNLVNLGVVAMEVGNFDEAILNFSNSLEIADEIGDKEGIAIACVNMGSLQQEMGNENEAVENFLMSLHIYKEMGDQNSQADVLTNLGNMESGVEGYSRSECLKKSLNIYKELGDKSGISSSCTNLGYLAMDMNENVESEKYFLQSQQLAKEIQDQFGLCKSLTGLAKLKNKEGKFAEALKFSTEAFNIGQTIGSPLLQTDASREIIESMVFQDNLKGADQYTEVLMDMTMRSMKYNFPVLSEQEKEIYMNKIAPDFDLIYDYALLRKESKPEYVANAYNTALMIKGLLLKSSTAMRRAIFESGNSAMIDQYYDWLALKRQVADAYAAGDETEELEKEANDLEKHLVRSSSSFSDGCKILSLRWQDVRATLGQNESAVEFVRFTHLDNFSNDSLKKSMIYCAIIVHENSKYPEMIELFDEKDLEVVLGDYPGNNQAYIDNLYGNADAGNSELYELIWKPLENSLSQSEKIFLSPVGLLHKMAFAALETGPEIYLCDKYHLENHSSTSSLVMEMEDHFEENSIITLFGGIDYDSESSTTRIWSYLEGSKTETDEIEKILKSGKITVNYFNLNGATEEQFKASARSSGIVHIATHGFFYVDPDEAFVAAIDEEESAKELVFRGGQQGVGVYTFVKNKNPLMRSGLIFAGANEVWNKTESKPTVGNEDGVLTAQEVSTMDMQLTDLVVLSACETGLGDIQGSEGVYGLQRSFKMAGVKYIIMSLWKVPDKETAEFMTTFYSILIKEQNIRKAFHETQQIMRRKYDPYNWAAFVLVE